MNFGNIQNMQVWLEWGGAGESGQARFVAHVCDEPSPRWELEEEESVQWEALRLFELL